MIAPRHRGSRAVRVGHVWTVRKDHPGQLRVKEFYRRRLSAKTMKLKSEITKKS